MATRKGRAMVTPGARSVLAGLVGHGIEASRTPPMHEAEGRAQGIPLVYRRIDPARMGAPPLAEVLDWAGRLGFDGLNVTHPYKQAVLPLLDTLSPQAAALGAVNTVVLRDGRREGHNTDVTGFAAALAEELSDAPRGRILLAGAGGAGAAAAEALLSWGAERLLIHDTAPERAVALAGRLAARHGAGRVAALAAPEGAGLDGAVNATPVGMAAHPGIALPLDALPPRAWVADLVYVPLKTALLSAARARGHRTVSGAAMAVHQAAGAFRLFTGRAADPGRMRATFDALGA